MRCPLCNGATGVYDSRAVDKAVRRRRRCESCAHHFTTVEYAPTPDGPRGRVSKSARMKGVVAAFDVRVHARFVGGELRLTIPHQVVGPVAGAAVDAAPVAEVEAAHA